MFWFSLVAASSTDLFERVESGLRVRVRLSPNASANRVEGHCLLPDGSKAIKVRVSAIPEKGKANAALTKLLSKVWDLPKTSITIIAGATERTKTLLLVDASESDRVRIEALFKD